MGDQKRKPDKRLINEKYFKYNEEIYVENQKIFEKSS